jgi:hypothetical protein
LTIEDGSDFLSGGLRRPLLQAHRDKLPEAEEVSVQSLDIISEHAEDSQNCLLVAERTPIYLIRGRLEV